MAPVVEKRDLGGTPAHRFRDGCDRMGPLRCKKRALPVEAAYNSLSVWGWSGQPAGRRTKDKLAPTSGSGRPDGRYSAASRTGSAFSTLAAQYLNSGIFPNGSSAGLVSRFAAAST